MSAPTLTPRAPRCSVEALIRTTLSLVADFGFSIRCRRLEEDVGIMDLDAHLIEIDVDSSLADQVAFVRECWAFCAIDPAASFSLEEVADRHLQAVGD